MIGLNYVCTKWQNTNLFALKKSKVKNTQKVMLRIEKMKGMSRVDTTPDE